MTYRTVEPPPPIVEHHYTVSLKKDPRSLMAIARSLTAMQTWVILACSTLAAAAVLHTAAVAYFLVEYGSYKADVKQSQQQMEKALDALR